MADNRATANDAMPPPRSEVGVTGWVLTNLFSSVANSIMTIISAAVIVLALWFGLAWIFGPADWEVIGTLGGQFIIGQYNTEQSCPGQNCFWRPQVGLLLAAMILGMAWGVAGGGVAKRIALGVPGVAIALAFLPYSFQTMGLDVRLLLVATAPAMLAGLAVTRYTRLRKPTHVVIAGAVAFLLTLILLRGWAEFTIMGLDARLLLVAIAPAILAGFAVRRYTRLRKRRHIVIVGVVALLLTLILLRGWTGWTATHIPSLQPVSELHWGGLMLNLLLAVLGIVLSLPIGIGLALGRRSGLPVVKLLCLAFIEVFRGVPLITLLFMSQVLVPLAFPENFPVTSLMRAAIVITLFSSAYMAENIRGGLQALQPGQAEAARALGLSGWQTTLLISLPQAIRNVIPAIVGQFIALFKDTSLVYIIGMLDVVEIGRAFIQGNPQYLANARELFIFLALIFWIFTYSMSYVSRRVERHLRVGAR